MPHVDAWDEGLDDLVQSFYRKPDVARAVRAFEGWLRSGESNLGDLHAFTWMAQVAGDVRAAFESVRSTRPRMVDAVLRGFSDPTFPRVAEGPPRIEDLDLLWVEFFITGSLAPVLRIIGVLDEPDVVRAKLSEWLKETGRGFFGKRTLARFLPVLARCAIPIRLQSLDIGGPLDVDLSVALTAKAGQLKFAELPVELSQAELLRIVAKSAAIWSLRATRQRTRPSRSSVRSRRQNQAERRACFCFRGSDQRLRKYTSALMINTAAPTTPASR